MLIKNATAKKYFPKWYYNLYNKQRKKQITKQKNKWFSWGWLIFWILFFYPAAIIYMLIKIGERK